MSKLDDYRSEIDAIDDYLARLLAKRMDVVLKVAQYKKENHLPVLHQNREDQVLERVSAAVKEEYRPSVRFLYSTIMDESKNYQNRQLVEPESFYEELGLDVAEPIEKPTCLACQGVPGAYSGEAAAKFCPGAPVRYYPSFQDVFEAVDRGEAPYGILPIENSNAGSVTQVYDLMKAYRFFIVRELKLPICHNLLVRPGVSLAAVTDVYSHPQGLSQCQEFLRAHPEIVPHEYSNTAAAAKLVAESSEPIASISSLGCAELYGLTVAEPSIQDRAQNFTRFLCISRKPEIPSEGGKISIQFQLPHQTGSLYKILARFFSASLNLTKIESRPLPGSDFEFIFYCDFTGNLHEAQVMALLSSLKKELQQFIFLGNYTELTLS